MSNPHRQREYALHKAGHTHVAGVDEVGRGAWAGPLVAAAVILPRGMRLPGLADSKRLTEKQREALDKKIRQHAIAYQICRIEHTVIDSHGLGQANICALQQAVVQLPVQADAVLVDRFSFVLPGAAVHPVAFGDAREKSIAAASIIAKVARDQMMRIYDTQFPQYGFGQHKGYGTAAHRAAIKKYGSTSIHRMSFRPLMAQSPIGQ